MNTLILLSRVWEILDECAPGFERRATDHNWKVTYNGLTYPSLPLGKHGARKASRTEIEVGHVKGLARQLNIVECVMKKLKE